MNLNLNGRLDVKFMSRQRRSQAENDNKPQLKSTTVPVDCRSTKCSAQPLGCTVLNTVDSRNEKR